MRLAIVSAFAAAMFSSAPLRAAEKPPRLGLCAGCHGETGHAMQAETPNLAGQNLAYLRRAIEQYQSGARDVPAMRAAVGMLGPAELARVLEWYAQSPTREPASP